MPSKENLNLYITMINVHLDVYAIRPHKPLGHPLCIFGSVCSEISIHINIYVITWIVPLCYYNGHIRNPLTSVLFLINNHQPMRAMSRCQRNNTAPSKKLYCFKLSLTLCLHTTRFQYWIFFSRPAHLHCQIFRLKYDERDRKRKPVNSKLD
jgi:hypothetical protein